MLKTFIAAIVIGALTANVALAQVIYQPNSSSGAGGGSIVTPLTAGDSIKATGTTTAGDSNQALYRVINIADPAYGAKCDGSTDDSAAISAAFQHIASGSGSGGVAYRLIGPNNGSVCVVKSSVNATGITLGGTTGNAITIDLSGLIIKGQFTGTRIPVVDMLGDRFITVVGLTVQGDCTTTPDVGIQIGRPASSYEADNIYLDHPQVTGCFNETAFYNLATETSTFVHPVFWNQSGYSVIQDGYNHWNVASLYQTVTIPTDTAISFNENTFVTPDMRNEGSTTPTVWLGFTARHKFIGGYVNNHGAEPLVVLYTETGTAGSTMLTWDVHGEISGITNTFLLSGSNASPTFQSLIYSDQDNFAANSVFALDTGVTSAALNAANISIGGFQATPTMFDTASAYTMSGDVVLPSGSTAFNTPASFAGCLTLGTQKNCALVPGSSENRIINGDFELDQRLNATSTTPTASAYVGDQWFARLSQSSKAAFQKVTANSAPNFPYSEIITSTSAYTSLATDKFTFEQPIEGYDVADLQWGTANAKNIIVSFLARSSKIGTFAFSLHNSGFARSYVATCTVAATATWTPCLASIPGDTTGSWFVNGSVGLYLDIDIGSGSNFNTTAGSWQAGQFYNTSGSTLLVATSGETMQITNVRIYANTIPTPYVAPRFADTYNRARRFYQTSIPQGTTPAQNAGLAGASCTRNPIASGEPGVSIQLNPPMDKTPTTITTFNPSNTNANWRDVTAGADVTVSVDPATAKGTTGFQIATSGTVTTLGDELCIHWSADAGL